MIPQKRLHFLDQVVYITSRTCCDHLSWIRRIRPFYPSTDRAGEWALTQIKAGQPYTQICCISFDQ